MRIWILAVVMLAAGVALGLSATSYELHHAHDRFELRASARSVVFREVEAGTPMAVIVGDEAHEFEMIPKGGEATCTFVVRNDGDGPLEVQRHTVSCGLCVHTTFQKASLQPGESVDFEVTLKARKPGAILDESIELRTNDPEREHITLNLTAFVTDVARASVEGLALGSISTEEEVTGVFRVYGYFSDEMEILKHEFTRREKLEYFDLEYRRLEPGEFSEEKQAKAAYEVSVHLKKGMPIGPLQQNIRLTVQSVREDTSDPVELQLNVPVGGAVTGDISFLPAKGLNVERSVLFLGKVDHGQGALSKLHLMVKGPHRDETKLSIGSTDPENILLAEIGEPKAIKNGEILMYPLTVSVAKDAPPVNRFEGAATKPGVVVIKATHPSIDELKLTVRFAVE